MLEQVQANHKAWAASAVADEISGLLKERLQFDRPQEAGGKQQLLQEFLWTTLTDEWTLKDELKSSQPLALFDCYARSACIAAVY